MTVTATPTTPTPAAMDAGASAGAVDAGAFAGAVAQLRARLRGASYLPADDGYDQARGGWDLTAEQHPCIVVVAADATDVAEAVRFARAVDADVAVQATGHGATRPADGAVLVVTSQLTAVTVDPMARRAYVAAGAKWAHVLAASEGHGLAPLLGSTTDVGAVGYTLGGGMGWLGRRYGLASDSALSFDLVTADGTQVRASARHEPELFWALRGGGAGSLGVVTGMEISLYPVTTVYAGNLFYPVELAGQVLRRWRDWVADAPEELTSSVSVMNFPPLDDVPEPMRGRSFAVVRGCWSGDLAAGAALIDDAWRSWAAPAIDMFGPLPFAAADLISNDPVDPMPAVGTSDWFDVLPDDAIDVIVDATVAGPAGPPPLVFSEIRHAGGAIRRQGRGAANERGRSGEMLLYMLGMAPDTAAQQAVRAFQQHTRARLSPFTTGAAYLNFLNGMERQERTADAYHPADLRRLAAVKAAVDPDNRFCHGFALPTS